jgi:hypothetical protein
MAGKLKSRLVAKKKPLLFDGGGGRELRAEVIE